MESPEFATLLIIIVRLGTVINVLHTDVLILPQRLF